MDFNFIPVFPDLLIRNKNGLLWVINSKVYDKFWANYFTKIVSKMISKLAKMISRLAKMISRLFLHLNPPKLSQNDW